MFTARPHPRPVRAQPEIYWMSHWDKWYTLNSTDRHPGRRQDGHHHTGRRPPGAPQRGRSTLPGDRCQCGATIPSAHRRTRLHRHRARGCGRPHRPLQAYATATPLLRRHRVPLHRGCMSYHVPKWPGHSPRELRTRRGGFRLFSSSARKAPSARRRGRYMPCLHAGGRRAYLSRCPTR